MMNKMMNSQKVAEDVVLLCELFVCSKQCFLVLVIAMTAQLTRKLPKPFMLKRIRSALSGNATDVRKANDLIRRYIEQNNMQRALEIYNGLNEPNLATVRMMAQSYIQRIGRQSDLMDRQLILGDLQQIPLRFKRCKDGESYLDKYWGLFLLDAEIKTFKEKYEYSRFVQLIDEYGIVFWYHHNAEIPTLCLLQFTPEISAFIIQCMFDCEFDRLRNGFYIRYKIKVTNRRSIDITSKQKLLELLDNVCVDGKVYKIRSEQYDEQTLCVPAHEIKKIGK